MKLSHLKAAGLALAVVAAPALAQPAPHSVTTVQPVHGPLKILPHHKHKICKTRWYHHHGSTKCWYH